MRHAAVYEEEDFREDNAEFSLGMGSLIGIFFGLALVCGVFFGFGYMMGHRAPGLYTSSEPLYVAPKPVQQLVAPKPSALVAEQPADASRVVLPTATEKAPIAQETAEGESRHSAQIAPPSANTPSRSDTPTPVAVPRAVAQPRATAAAASLPPASVPVSTGGGQIMVQIAAVKSRADAEALASAVRKDGFSPTVRTEPQDKLLHVQIGPFANRDDAKAMRQRLSSAGYDAFIK